jgi:hypothetical protein
LAHDLGSVRQPCVPEASTTGMTVGLWLRCGETGTLRRPGVALPGLCPLRRGFDHLAGFREKLQRLAVQCVGKPTTLSLSALPSICAVLSPPSGLGCASKAALKAGAFSAVVLRAAIFSANSPSQGCIPSCIPANWP